MGHVFMKSLKWVKEVPLRFLKSEHLLQGLNSRGQKVRPAGENALKRFLRIVHVKDTTPLSLKAAIDAFLAKFGLSTSIIKGQGYDAASNMQGEFNGLTSLILRENSSFLYIHCFTHQLKLALVLATKNHIKIASLFSLIVSLINAVGGYCKHHEMLCELHFFKVHKSLSNFEIYSEISKQIERLICCLSSPIGKMFCLGHQSRWLLEDRYIDMIDWIGRRSHRKALKVTNMDYYIVELFYIVIDTQLQELNNRFNEVNTKLLLCVSFLCPNEDFATFGKHKLIHLSQIYSFFFQLKFLHLITNWRHRIIDMRLNWELSNSKGTQDLSKKMADTKKNIVYPLAYCLVKNRIGDQWMSDCLIPYVEKEKIIPWFQHMRK
ncbi:hypothetical protein E1A91_D09G060100v1, partial [Gossypium mustelinum]